ncbi:unnamed protein product [Peronospora belbahrii]|uniref:Uncharacterized protein n=1 Tax=Peronospora belbahrii TaxID=622444 RepID=A0AAU9KRN0_9STRA|nr:unnamed protein product [Peronospora belbahrii]
MLDVKEIQRQGMFVVKKRQSGEPVDACEQKQATWEFMTSVISRIVPLYQQVADMGLYRKKHTSAMNSNTTAKSTQQRLFIRVLDRFTARVSYDRGIYEYASRFGDCSEKMQQVQRRSNAVIERGLRLAQEEQASRTIACEKVEQEGTICVSAATGQRAKKKGVPLWMHKGVPRATTTKNCVVWLEL